MPKMDVLHQFLSLYILYFNHFQKALRYFQFAQLVTLGIVQQSRKIISKSFQSFIKCWIWMWQIPKFLVSFINLSSLCKLQKGDLLLKYTLMILTHEEPQCHCEHRRFFLGRSTHHNHFIPSPVNTSHPTGFSFFSTYSLKAYSSILPVESFFS